MTPLLVAAALLLPDRDPDALPAPPGAIARLRPPRLEHGRPVHHLAFSPDDTKLASVAGGERVRVWDVRTGRQLRSFGPAHDRPRNHVAFPDDRTVVALLRDGSLVRFDVAAGREAMRVPIPGAIDCRDYWLGPDGRRLLIEAADGTRREYDAAGRLVGPVAELPAAPFYHAVTADGRTTARGVEYGEIWLRPDPWPAAMGNYGIRDLQVTDGGSTVAVWEGRPGSTPPADDDPSWTATTQTDLRTGRQTAVPEPGLVRVSADGRRAVVAGPGPAVGLVNRETATSERLPHPPAASRLRECVFLADDRLYLPWAGRAGVVRHLPTGREVPLPGGQGRLTRTVASADGRRLAAASFDAVTVWDAASGAVVGRRAFVSNVVRSDAGLALSADGRTLAAWGVWVDGCVLLDAGTWRPVPARDLIARPASAAAFSADGRHVAVGGPDGRVRVLERATGRVRTEFRNRGPVRAVAFTPDGRRLATAGRDDPGYVWDVYDPTGGLIELDATDWAAVGSDDAVVGFAAVRRMIGFPAAAVALVRANLRPTTAADRRAVEAAIARLNAAAFADRHAAARTVAEWAGEFEPLVRRAHDATDSAEARERLEAALAGAAARAARTVRAVEVLEVIGTADARKLLAGYSAGEPDARLTREAATALDRLPSGAAR